MDDKLQRLRAIGFTFVDVWQLHQENLIIDLHQFASLRNVLYAFVMNDQLCYIGKTTQSLAKRMAGYCRPGGTQSTNIKNHAFIRAALLQGNPVTLYILPDNGLLLYGGFHINLAAGLEDSLLRTLLPPWNGGQKEVHDGEMTAPEA